MALAIIDRTEPELTFYDTIINGRLYHFFYTGKAKTITGEIDTYLKLPRTKRPLQSGKVSNSIAAIQVRKPGAGLDSHSWKVHHVRRQSRTRIDHLDLLLILPRENVGVVSLKFTRRGTIDFLHYDAEKLYLGIQLRDDETVRIGTHAHHFSSDFLYYTAEKIGENWESYESSAGFAKSLTWRSSQAITI